MATKNKILKSLAGNYPELVKSIKNNKIDVSEYTLKKLIKEYQLDIVCNTTLPKLLESPSKTFELFSNSLVGFNTASFIIDDSDSTKIDWSSKLNYLVLNKVLPSDKIKEFESKLIPLLQVDEKLTYDLIHKRAKIIFVTSQTASLLVFMYLPYVDINFDELDKLYELASDYSSVDTNSPETAGLKEKYNKVYQKFTDVYLKEDLANFASQVDNTYYNTANHTIYNLVIEATKLRYLNIV